MKILYIAHERQAAQVAATALRRMVPDGRLTWADSPAAALSWIAGNRDAAAVIVDAPVARPGGTVLLERIRELAETAAVAVLGLEQLQQLSGAADADAARREAQQQSALARATRVSMGLQERMLELEAELQGVVQRHAAQSAANDQLTRREAELSRALEEVSAARGATEQQLAATQAARQQAVQHAARELAAADERCTSLENRLERETALRQQLEEQLAAAALARDDARQAYGVELTALRAQLAGRDRDDGVALARSTRICTVLQGRLLELEAALRSGEERHAADAAQLERLSGRERGLTAAVEEALAARTVLGQRLSEVEMRYERTASDMSAAADRCALLEQQLQEHAATTSALEERLAAAHAARDDAARCHASELAALSARAKELEAKHQAATAQNGKLQRQLQDIAAALESTRLDWQLEVAAWTEQRTRHEAEAGAALARMLAARDAAEVKLADVERERSTEVAALLGQLGDLQARFDRAVSGSTALAARLREETAARRTVEERLAVMETARREAEQHQAAELSLLRGRLATAESRFADAVTHRTALEQELATAAAALAQAHREWQSDVTAAAERLSRREGELTRALNEAMTSRTAAETRLAQSESARRQVEARAVTEGAFAAERHALLQARLEARSVQVAELQQDAAALRRQLGALRTHADALRRDLAQVPALQGELEKSRKENRRQFERAPYGLFECKPDGGVTRVNHTLAHLLGYRRGADINLARFVATAFETAADLRWLLERAQQAGAPETIETTLTARDRRPVAVRLHAYASEGLVTIAVADLTKLHEVEHRLREAERLEAVGRVASEVAATCDTLLSDASQEGRQWLAALESDTRLRQQGELLLGDVSRAAGFLRQFVAYGHQQISNVSPVSLPGLLREMAPVLKRVLGDEIRLMLPRTTDRFDIDVDAERVERIFVNIANWARERMPHGGRVKIQLATTVVTQKFLASHPKVRPGTHVVITITEVQGAVWPALPVRLPSTRAQAAPVPAPAHKPGMDLGAVLAMIGDAGGHLWMSAEPAGNVTLQIHLPKRVQADRMVSSVGSVANRSRQLGRWFRH